MKGNPSSIKEFMNTNECQLHNNYTTETEIQTGFPKFNNHPSLVEEFKADGIDVVYPWPTTMFFTDVKQGCYQL